MENMDDRMYDAILRELGAPAKSVPVEEDLLGAAREMTSAAAPAPAPPQPASETEWAGKMVAHASTQLAEERARREVAESSAHRSHAIIAWAVAGVLGAIVLYLLGRRSH